MLSITKMIPLIKSMSIDDITHKMEKYLPVRSNEKDKFGEVFTPPSLINELLDNLPKQVWSNPNLRWLDPASGIGNFFIYVYDRLMSGLSKKIPDINERSRHILNNMLYMVEINPKNVRVAKKIFGNNANIVCANFLSERGVKKWTTQFNNIDKFDIIIGNLPFNEETNEENRKTVSLWPKFVYKSLDILNENGYLAFIHPQNWRSPENKLWNILSNKQLLYIHIYSPEHSKKLFGNEVHTKIDLYVLHNVPIHSSTNVVDQLGDKYELKLNKLPFLSNYSIKDFNKIISTKNTINILYDTMCSTTNSNENKSDKFKYPVIKSITEDNKLHFRYTDDNTKCHINIPKVIINGGRYAYPYNDYEGKYGMSQNLFGIPITSKKQGDDIVKAINSEKFKTLLNSTKWSTFGIDYKMFKHFRNDFFKYFLKETSTKTIKRKKFNRQTNMTKRR